MIGHPRRRVERLLLLADRWRRPPWARPFPAEVERVYCHHIRKTAGTSLARSFLALGGEEPEAVERRMARSFLRRTTSANLVFATGLIDTLQGGAYHFGWSHIPAHRITLPRQTFVVTVLRDPIARVISYYRYLVAGDLPGAAFPVSESERRLAGGGFSAFLDAVSDHELLRQLYTFSRTFSPEEAAEEIGRCSLVLHTEHFAAGVSELSSALKLPLQVRRDRTTAGETIEPTPTEFDHLRTRLDAEYRFLSLVAREHPGSVVATASVKVELARRPLPD